MGIVSFYKDLAQSLSLTRYYRVKNYLKDLDEHIDIKSKKDRKRIDDMILIIDKVIKRLSRIYTTEIVFYCIIYFSFISYFFSDFFLLSQLAILVSQIISIIGTTIFFIFLFITNKMKNLYYQDMNLLTSHVISIYSKYEETATAKKKEGPDIYIEFFKTRGF